MSGLAMLPVCLVRLWLVGTAQGGLWCCWGPQAVLVHDADVSQHPEKPHISREELSLPGGISLSAQQPQSRRVLL